IRDFHVTGVQTCALPILSATVAVSALFLLVELVERIGVQGRPQLRDVDVVPGEDTNLDDEEEPLVGRAFPISIALLGLAFVAAAIGRASCRGRDQLASYA